MNSPRLHAQVESEANQVRLKAELFKHKNQYDSSYYYYQQLGYLFEKSGTGDQRILNEINIADLLILMRDYELASKVLEQVEVQLNDESTASALVYSSYLQVRGSYYLSTGERDSARSYLEESIRIREQSEGKNDTLLRYAFNKLGNMSLGLGNYKDAYRYHEKALELSLNKHDKVNFLSASSYQNLGITAHMMGDYSKAESFFLRSLEFNEQLYTESDPALAAIYINLGKFYNDISRYDLAIEYYDKAEAVLSSDYGIQNIDLTASMLWNKGNVFTHQGDYEKAISYLNRVLYLYNSMGSNFESKIPLILMDIGLVYDAMGELSLATEYYLKSSKNHKNPGIVKSYRNLGNTYSKRGQVDSARYYYRKAINIATKLSDNESYDLALCYQYLGENLKKVNYDSAFYFLNKSLIILKNIFGDENRDVARAKLIVGAFYIDYKKYNEAISIIEEALNSFVVNYDIERDLLTNINNETYSDLFLPDALNLQAKAYFIKYIIGNDTSSLQNSLLSLNQAWSITEAIRKTYNDEESQIILNNNARKTVDLGLKVCLMLFEQTGRTQYLSEAFNFSEKGKAIVLLSALRGLEARSNASIPNEIQEMEKFLSSEIAFYNNLVYNEQKKKNPDQDKLALWNDRLFTYRISYDSLLNAYKTDYPEYYRLKYDYSIIDDREIARLLDSGQVMLEYHIADTVLYGFFISNNKFVVRELGKMYELSIMLDSLRGYMESRDFIHSGRDDVNSLVRYSSGLYNMLIRPFAPEILNKRVLIVPDGELGHLAFDLLLVDVLPENETSYAQFDWLIRHCAISYASSATIYFEPGRSSGKTKNKGELLAFAPNYDINSHFRDITGETDSLQLNLTPLKGTHEEVLKISRFYHTREYFDQEASESNFKHNAGGFKVLHLAMHTLIDNQNPLYSKLVFSLPPPGSMEDGLLNTHELFNLDLEGELAVLSACNTGTGKLERGEGIISLARGFFYAGIPSVVMTLWEIEDHSSADLMSYFYSNLANGLTKDVALQKAKLAYMENAGKLQSHPYFWAGYVNIGKTSPVYKSENTIYYFPVLCAILTIAIALFQYFFINRRVYFQKKPL